MKPAPHVLQRKRNVDSRRSSHITTSGNETMAPSIPTYRPFLTPARLAMAGAAIALLSQFGLILADALAASEPNSQRTAVACSDAPVALVDSGAASPKRRAQ
jgi:hypothetical protein